MEILVLDTTPTMNSFKELGEKINKNLPATAAEGFWRLYFSLPTFLFHCVYCVYFSLQTADFCSSDFFWGLSCSLLLSLCPINRQYLPHNKREREREVLLMISVLFSIYMKIHNLGLFKDVNFTALQ